MTADALSADWVAAAVKASAHRKGAGFDGVVAITIGKSKKAVLSIVDGCVVDGSAVDAKDDAPTGEAVTIPTTAKQLGSLVDGSESLAQSFMRGDIKPVGATGALLAAVDLFEDPTFRERLAELA